PATSVLPDVPSTAAPGLPGFDTSGWCALLAPGATPDATRAVIERASIGALTAPDARQRLAEAGVEVAADGAAELQRRIGEEMPMWRDVITRARIRLE